MSASHTSRSESVSASAGREERGGAGVGPQRTQWFQLGIICVASFVVWAGFGAILPYLPVFLQEQAHASVWLIGVIAAAYYVGSFAFSALFGRLSDSIGRKPVIVAGIAFFGLAQLLFISSTQPAWFVFFRFLEGVGAAAVIRVDANVGYSIEETARFFERTQALAIEFVEQPVPREAFDQIRTLRPAWRRRIAADESLHDERDALALSDVTEPACGIFNIKLMKCGGIRPALRIATIAETAGVALMWGCMDESRISIAAALHAAFASPATRYLDLDGSLDLARDVVFGGFTLEGGVLRTTDTPGLGVRAI